jgi:hypothetical protein
MDEWAKEAAGIANAIESTEKLGSRLPKVGACTPDEHEAKSLVAGLKAAGTANELRQLAIAGQSVANRAQQPFTTEEADKIWADASDFVLQVGRLANELQSIATMIRHKRDQFLATANPSAKSPAIATKGTTNSQRILTDSKTVYAGIGELERTILDLFGTMQSTIEELSQGRVRGSKSMKMAEQLESAEFAIGRYDLQVSRIRALIEGAPDLAHILASGGTRNLTALEAKVRESVLAAESQCRWCRAWLNMVICRLDSRYHLPADVPESVARTLTGMDPVIEALERHRKAYGSVGREEEASPVDLGMCDVARFSDDSVKVLRALLESPPKSSPGHTVMSLSKATGIGDQKVRRLLHKTLGPRTAAKLVRVKKHPRGTGKLSPPDTYEVPASLVETVQTFLADH